jgi:hypothetical protein
VRGEILLRKAGGPHQVPDFRGHLDALGISSHLTGTVDYSLKELGGAVGTGKMYSLQDLLRHRPPGIDSDRVRQATPVGKRASLYGGQHTLERPCLHRVFR